MKVKREYEPINRLNYGDIKQGQSFGRDSQGSKVFIKTDLTGFSGYVCVDVATGSSYSYGSEHGGFYLVDAEVVVNG